jgi:hypothetical protein
VIYTFQNGEHGVRHSPSFFFYSLEGWLEVSSMENQAFGISSQQAALPERGYPYEYEHIRFRKSDNILNYDEPLFLVFFVKRKNRLERRRCFPFHIQIICNNHHRIRLVSYTCD